MFVFCVSGARDDPHGFLSFNVNTFGKLFIKRVGLFSLEPVMENLEVNLSSLAIISKHVDKSQNQIGQYLSKQVRSCQNYGAHTF